MVLIIVIVIIIAISEKVDKVREKKRRMKLISEFKDLKKYEYTRMDDAIFDRYQKDGVYPFRKMKRLLRDEDNLNTIYSKLSQELKSKQFKRYRRLGRERNLHKDDWKLINEMTSDGIIFRENSKLKINQAMNDTLNMFMQFLKDKGN